MNGWETTILDDYPNEDIVSSIAYRIGDAARNPRVL